MAPREKQFELDLESGRTSHEDENASKELIISDKRQVQKSFTKALLSVLSIVGSIKHRNGFDSFSYLAKSGKVPNEIREEISRQERLYAIEKSRNEKNKNIKTSSKKAAPKPPRPPKGPSFDAFDQKLVREIVQLQLARRNRATLERMKAAQKTRAAKASSSNSGIFAMIISIVFFIILIFRCKT